MKKFALITAGGSGSRMGTALPKQFLLLHGKPVLWHTIRAFQEAYADIHFILVIPAAHAEAGKALLEELHLTAQSELVEGGATRFHSVQNGLQNVEPGSIVFVHDGVRCLVTPDLIRRSGEQAAALGSAIPAVASTDSVRITDAQGGHQSIDRNRVRIIQTPQTFRSDIILPAFQQAYRDAFTDEATVVEAAGTPVFMIEGEYGNIKITRPADLLVAETILQERSAR
ncbi:MAG TPA: 2-C-methyl-D-erythritol 4-phosphate cytidylyltransferase [Sediminibacterium sp.]|nr:2-C-methyl-D-erythritol 4-phosphate cytidylyltransferase [Sediminibacterium sp.]